MLNLYLVTMSYELKKGPTILRQVRLTHLGCCTAHDKRIWMEYAGHYCKINPDLTRGEKEGFCIILKGFVMQKCTLFC